MASLPQIQNQLREQFSELCEACFAEQEWLEEGRYFDPSPAKKGQPADGESVGFVDAKLSE